jgi:hypothetical protein
MIDHSVRLLLYAAKTLQSNRGSDTIRIQRGAAVVLCAVDELAAGRDSSSVTGVRVCRVWTARCSP